jgi:hypothetical protein
MIARVLSEVVHYVAIWSIERSDLDDEQVVVDIVWPVNVDVVLCRFNHRDFTEAVDPLFEPNVVNLGSLVVVKVEIVFVKDN